MHIDLPGWLPGQIGLNMHFSAFDLEWPLTLTSRSSVKMMHIDLPGWLPGQMGQNIFVDAFLYVTVNNGGFSLPS